MLTGSTRPRQPRPPAPVCVELGSAAADGEISIQSKVFCTSFDQVDPRARGQRARLPPSTAAFPTTFWEINVNPEMLRQGLILLLYTKAFF